MTSKSRASKTPAKKSGSNAQYNKKSNAGKKQKTLDELLEDNLKDIYSAEVQLLEALPEMADAAQNEDLQDAFTNHYEQTLKQVSRLEKIFDRFDIDISEVEPCEAMAGLIAEGKKIIEEYEESPVRDSALIIGSQKIEHYEIASYGSLCELADVLGYSNLHDLLGRSLDEEENTDELLTEIASDINDEAKEMSDAHNESYSEEMENVR
ncbi:MAG: ferritin-like domain-containing protein [Bacteroidota bacterium]|nr:ferritin-like domain-containing protein [Bacteroidota bacterium]